MSQPLIELLGMGLDPTLNGRDTPNTQYHDFQWSHIHDEALTGSWLARAAGTPRSL